MQHVTCSKVYLVVKLIGSLSRRTKFSGLLYDAFRLNLTMSTSEFGSNINEHFAKTPDLVLSWPLKFSLILKTMFETCLKLSPKSSILDFLKQSRSKVCQFFRQIFSSVLSKQKFSSSNIFRLTPIKAIV